MEPGTWVLGASERPGERQAARTRVHWMVQWTQSPGRRAGQLKRVRGARHTRFRGTSTLATLARVAAGARGAGARQRPQPRGPGYRTAHRTTWDRRVASRVRGATTRTGVVRVNGSRPAALRGAQGPRTTPPALLTRTTAAGQCKRRPRQRHGAAVRLPAAVAPATRLIARRNRVAGSLPGASQAHQSAPDFAATHSRCWCCKFQQRLCRTPRRGGGGPRSDFCAGIPAKAVSPTLTSSAPVPCDDRTRR